nr:hypothetical protein [Tanacetum cinerariifolium]
MRTNMESEKLIVLGLNQYPTPFAFHVQLIKPVTRIPNITRQLFFRRRSSYRRDGTERHDIGENHTEVVNRIKHTFFHRRRSYRRQEVTPTTHALLSPEEIKRTKMNQTTLTALSPKETNRTILTPLPPPAIIPEGMNRTTVLQCAEENDPHHTCLLSEESGPHHTCSPSTEGDEPRTPALFLGRKKYRRSYNGSNGWRQFVEANFCRVGLDASRRHPEHESWDSEDVIHTSNISIVVTRAPEQKCVPKRLGLKKVRVRVVKWWSGHDRITEVARQERTQVNEGQKFRIGDQSISIILNHWRVYLCWKRITKWIRKIS